MTNGNIAELLVAIEPVVEEEEGQECHRAAGQPAWLCSGSQLLDPQLSCLLLLNHLWAGGCEGI